MNKICENCNKDFKASKPSQRFCSRECSRKHNGVTVNCAYCGKEKRIGVSQVSKNNFCNAECRKKFEDNARYNKVKHYIEIESGSGCTLLSTSCKNKRDNLKIKCRCGEDFTRAFEDFKYSTKKGCDYCSGIKKRNKVCPICKKEFKPVKKTQICCSKSCAQVLRNPPIYTNCCICGLEIKRTKSNMDRYKGIIVLKNAKLKV